MKSLTLIPLVAISLATSVARLHADDIQISENDQEIKLVTPDLEAAIRKQGYVSGVAAGSLLDKRTGFRDAGFGLDIVDWIMEPGSDVSYREQLPQEGAVSLVRRFKRRFAGISRSMLRECVERAVE